MPSEKGIRERTKNKFEGLKKMSVLVYLAAAGLRGSEAMLFFTFLCSVALTSLPASFPFLLPDFVKSLTIPAGKLANGGAMQLRLPYRK